MTPLPDEDRIEHYVGELVTYARSHFPMRFYGGEAWWMLYTAAAVLRLADMAESVLAHMADRRDQDASAALRGMYELAVTVTWILIDPEHRKAQWEGEALIQQLRLHNDLAAFGGNLLTSADVESAKGAVGLPPLTNRAEESDVHWAPRVAGLHAPGHLLSFRGLYNAIYRLGSQATHGSIASLLVYIRQEPARFVVQPPEPASNLPYALVSPLLSMTLVIVATQVLWIDEVKIRALNDAATQPSG